MTRRAKTLLSAAALGLLALGGLAAWGGPLADIRPDVIDPARAQPDREAKGRALMEASLEAHGGRAGFEAHEVLSFHLVDEWPSPWGWMSPWPEASAEADVALRRHSFDSALTFTAGSQAGARWGIEDWHPWEQPAGGERQASDNPDLRFMLPTLHYFVEMPLRLTEAEIIRYVGQQEVNGQTYEVVYLTWGSVEANPQYDQYLAFLDPETHQLAKIQYTVREIMRMASGTAHLQDVAPVGQVRLPQRITVTAAPGDDLSAGFMHEMRFTERAVDAVELARLGG